MKVIAVKINDQLVEDDTIVIRSKNKYLADDIKKGIELLLSCGETIAEVSIYKERSSSIDEKEEPVV